MPHLRFNGSSLSLLLLLALFSGTPLAAPGQSWDADEELMPYDPARATTPVPAVRPAPPIDGDDYEDFANGRFFSGGQYVGGNFAPANQFRGALRAARYYRLLGDPTFADRAIDAVNEHLAYVNDPASGFEASFTHLQYAGRTYTLLRDGSAQKPTGWQTVIYDWLVALDAHVPAQDRHRGAKGMALAYALGEDAMVELCPIVGATCTDPAVLAAADHADGVWEDWYTAGGIGEHSDNYWGGDMLLVTWWLQLSPWRSDFPANPFDDPKVLSLAEATLTQLLPIGPMAHFGDGAGFAASSRHYVGALETWASATGDGRFRWAAENLFAYLVAHRTEMDQWGNITTDSADNALMAAIARAEEGPSPAQPTAPTMGSSALSRDAWKWNAYEESEATRRRFDLIPGQQVSDKVVLRTGWAPDETMAVVAADRRGPHGHSDSGAINTYVAQGSVLLTSNAYRVEEAYYHNTVSIDPPAYANLEQQIPWQNGARSPDLVGQPGTIHVTFKAKRISGSNVIGVYRPHTAASVRVEITDEWETYSVDTTFTGTSTNRPVLFTSLASYHENINQVVDAEFLIDDVHLAMDQPPPNADFPKEFGFDEDLEGWSVLDDRPEGVSGCTPPVRNPGDCAIEISHETADAAVGTGAMRVSFDVGHEAVRDSAGASTTAFQASGDFGYAAIEMPDHLGKPFDVTRRILFLGEAGLLVRDEIEATRAYQATVGAGWHFTQVVQESAQGWWARGAQTAMAVPRVAPEAGKPSFLMHWANRPKDLLIKFHSPAPDASFNSADVTSPPAELTDDIVGVRTPFARRVSLDIDRLFPEGEKVIISSFLRPHSPAVDGAPISTAIDWLVDSDLAGVVEILGSNPWETTVVGINRTGGCIDVPGYALSTDAVAFRVQYGVNGVIAYDVVDATSLGQDECAGPDSRSLVDLAEPDSRHHRGLPDRVSNSDFSEGIGGWSAQTGGSTGTADVDLIDLGGSLRVDMSNATTGEMPRSHQAGVAPQLEAIDDQQRVQIEFDARLLSASPVALSAQRQWGGSSREAIAIDGDWRRYRLSYAQSFAASATILAPVAVGATGAFPRTEEASFEIDNVSVVWIPNLTANPGFDGSSAADWQPLGAATTSIEAVDVVTSSLAPALRVVIPAPAPGSEPLPWEIGAKATVQALPASSRLRVSFDARSVGGSTCISVRRPDAVSSVDEVELNGSWNRYGAEFDSPDSGDGVLFGICDPGSGAEFLIDNVVMTRVDNRLQNGSFDRDVTGWEGWLDGSPTSLLDDPSGPGTYLSWNPDVGEPYAPTLLVQVNAGSPPPPGNLTGAVARLRDASVLEAGEGLHVSFSARLVAGSGLLRVGLAAEPGGSSALVQLTGSSQRFAVDLDGGTSDVLFSLVDTSGNAADGQLVLDDVVVTSRH